MKQKTMINGNRIDTWINGELVTLDLAEVWRETFAKWDCLVDTDLASKVASAVEKALFQNATVNML
jgi:hypothetical protein